MIQGTQLRLAYGARVLFDQADFLIRPGDKIGLVGPNGAGKTSLLRLLAGEERPDGGQLVKAPQWVVGYFRQDVGEMAGRSVLAEVLAGAGRISELAQELEDLEHRMSDPEGPGLSDTEMSRYGDVQTEFLALDGYSLESRAAEILTGLGISPERHHDPVETFSGGWKMRIALAKILLLQPDCLLIDEPTNHLDLESVLWLEGWLRDFSGALVMTSHDREFMTRLCSRTLEVSDGALTVYSGDYDFYLREREIRRENLIAAHKRQQAMLAKEEEFIARFAARASHAAQVQSRVKTLEKIERIVIPREIQPIRFEFGSVKRSGDVVYELKALGKVWPKPSGGTHRVFEGLEAVVSRGQKIALTGVNGAGKSTLLKVLAGLSAPTEGQLLTGASLIPAYFSQYSGDSLNPERTVFEELAERLPQETIGTLKTLLGAFQFSGDDTEKRISVLSGGEKSRLMLAVLLAQRPNLLLLDEPTNHLDILTREVLLQALQDFEGTLLIVSHDRWFLRHLVNRVFHLEQGRLQIFEGGYGYYLEKTGLV